MQTRISRPPKTDPVPNSEDLSSANALLLGMGLRLMCTRLDLPLERLADLMQQQVHSVPEDTLLGQALRHQGHYVDQVLRTPQDP